VYLLGFFFYLRVVTLVMRLQVTTRGYFKMLNERHAFEVIRNRTLLLDRYNQSSLYNFNRSFHGVVDQVVLVE
jgi:hypothetical protein